jgi:hypothetical protein
MARAIPPSPLHHGERRAAPRPVDAVRYSGGARESNRPRRKADELRNKTEQERTPPAIVEDCGRTTVLCGDEGSLVVLLSGAAAAESAAPPERTILNPR